MNSLVLPKLFQVYFLITLLLFKFSTAIAQPTLPQRSNTARAIQPIHFGSFCVTGGSGGTVTVGYDGNRSATGDIILLNKPPFAQPAIFDLKLCQSRNVCINFETPIVSLNGNTGSITLQIGPTDKGPDGACFVINSNCELITTIRVGGTLTITGSSLPGTYSGNFSIKFIHQ